MARNVKHIMLEEWKKTAYVSEGLDSWYGFGQSKKMTKSISNSKLIRYPNQKDAVMGKQDE